jgi:hypothetical protein
MKLKKLPIQVDLGRGRRPGTHATTRCSARASRRPASDGLCHRQGGKPVAGRRSPSSSMPRAPAIRDDPLDRPIHPQRPDHGRPLHGHGHGAGTCPSREEGRLPPSEPRTWSSISSSSDVVQLEAYKVSESGTDSKFDASAMGTGSSYSAKQIMEMSSIRRDLQDFQNLDPRAVVMQVSPSDPAYTFSVAGQNPRENALLVDGVSGADNFGLNSNGYAGLRNPVPLSGSLGHPRDQPLRRDLQRLPRRRDRRLPQVRHERVPRVRLRDLHGNSMRGPTRSSASSGPTSPRSSTRPASRSAARSSRTSCSSSSATRPSARSRRPRRSSSTPSTRARAPRRYAIIVSTATRSAASYTYDPGTLNAISHTWEQNFVGKIDWNISDYQKFSFTFRHTIGDAPVFYNYTFSNETSFDTSWYNSNRSDQSYTAQLNSDWSKVIPNFHTEIEATYKRYNGTATLNGPKLPALTIDGVSGYSQPTRRRHHERRALHRHLLGLPGQQHLHLGAGGAPLRRLLHRQPHLQVRRAV